jgi:coenzyme F420-0:L-glutamate ligase/coenzyme F420-1:gamma-L-glutamate ligase
MADVRIIPIGGLPEVLAGDDLPKLLVRAMREAGLALQDQDVLAVTQKIVSKAEGRVVAEGPEGKAGWVARETRRIVAKRDDVVIAETRHGLVCANAGVDASNVAEGFLTLLPEDPDGSAERIRAAVSAATGRRIGVVMTDTFGRAWRRGVVNVAIGCAGLPSLVDLRGTKDASGRVLEATIVALADEVAAASGLAMGKADGIPAAIVRGVRAEAPPLPASEIVRPPDEDLFRTSPLQALHAMHSGMRLGPGEVPRAALEAAVRAAYAAIGAEGGDRLLFVALHPGPVRRRLLAAVQLEIPGEAALVIVPFVSARAGPEGPNQANGERDARHVSGGAAIQNLRLALHAQGVASHWTPVPALRWHEAGDSLGVSAEWTPLGIITAGPHAAGTESPPARGDVETLLREIT